ncbi:MAG: RidA family protein [Methylophilaceae bacterium]|nr:RidA family protein [Methyloradius sp.]
MTDIQRINPTARWSDMTIFNGIAHFVEVPADTSADIHSQVKQVLAQADTTLLSGGSDKSRILSATIYITDFNNLATLNAAWEAWLPAGCAPSRACLKVELADPKYLLEIAFVAAVKK